MTTIRLSPMAEFDASIREHVETIDYQDEHGNVIDGGVLPPDPSPNDGDNYRERRPK